MVLSLVFLGSCNGFGGFSWFFVVFLGSYNGFELLTTKTTIKTTSHEFVSFTNTGSVGLATAATDPHNLPLYIS